MIKSPIIASILMLVSAGVLFEGPAGLEVGADGVEADAAAGVGVGVGVRAGVGAGVTAGAGARLGAGAALLLETTGI